MHVWGTLRDVVEVICIMYLRSEAGSPKTLAFGLRRDDVPHDVRTCARSLALLPYGARDWFTSRGANNVGCHAGLGLANGGGLVVLWGWKAVV